MPDSLPPDSVNDSASQSLTQGQIFLILLKELSSEEWNAWQGYGNDLSVTKDIKDRFVKLTEDDGAHLAACEKVKKILNKANDFI